ncbi:MAG: YdcF family protein [Pseudomonadota bacterium]
MAFLYFAPLIWLHLRADIRTADTADPVEAVIVFGALVRNASISPLHKQRLDTGIRLWRNGQADKIVVSNSLHAARVMRQYLLDQNVPFDVIELDGNAPRTPDTCRSERAHVGGPRSVAFVSQTFHLPRWAYQCRLLGVAGQLVTATPIERAIAPLLTKIRVRSWRHTREAGLLWGAILSLYPVD